MYDYKHLWSGSAIFDAWPSQEVISGSQAVGQGGVNFIRTPASVRLLDEERVGAFNRVAAVREIFQVCASQRNLSP